MQNYYEILSVDPDCSEDDLKKAYRKLALLWHPDKHANEDTEKQNLATETFKRIQNAYSVLSDAADRSWYDRHKNDVTGDGEESIGLVDIFKYFSTTVYENFSDSEQGFYAVYSSVFSRIYEEERKYFDKESGSTWLESDAPPPVFGSSSSSPGEFLPFYSYWTTYSSKMHFCWVESFDSRDGRNRSERRYMEKENEGARRSARKKRTDDIHSLAEFIMKRDKRYIAYQIDLQRKAEEAEAKRKVAAMDMQAALAKKRIENAELMRIELEKREAEIAESGSFRLADFDDELDKRRRNKKGSDGATRTVRTSQLPTSQMETSMKSTKKQNVTQLNEQNQTREEGGKDKDYGNKNHTKSEVNSKVDDLEGAEEVDEKEEEEEEEEEEVVEILSCEVCHKFFKSEASMKNHLSSKKHIAAMVTTTHDEDRNDEEEEEEEEEGGDDDEDDKQDVIKDDNKSLSKNDPKHAQSSNKKASGNVDEEKKKPKLNKTQLRLLRKKTEASLSSAAGAVKLHGDIEQAEVEPAGLDVKSFIRGKLTTSSHVIGGAKGVPMAAVAYKETLAAKLHQGLECRACKQVFDTRNELFSHIKVTGHVVVSDDLLDAIGERGLGGGGGSGGKAAARKLKGRAKRLE